VLFAAGTLCAKERDALYFCTFAGFIHRCFVYLVCSVYLVYPVHAILNRDTLHVTGNTMKLALRLRLR